MASLAERGDSLTLAERVAVRIRERIVQGAYRPGHHLFEIALSEELGVSRNSLREAFRLLTKEGLLRHEPNRGVFVATPSMATIVDVYRVRRFIECQAVAQAHPKHPATTRMRAAVDTAGRLRDARDWLGVGSADLAFHAAIVDLADSPRLSTFFAQIAAELRLAFGLIDDPEFLHGPYIDLNRDILALVEAGKTAAAAASLKAYLARAERTILGAYSRMHAM